MDDIKNQIVSALIHNQHFFKDITQEYKLKQDQLLASENESFHNDVKDQYKAICCSLIAGHLSAKMGVPMEPILEVLEDINIVEYLNS
jgi:hypothetical protein